MRVLIFAVIAVMATGAASALPAPDPVEHSPFPVERGTAPPPPAEVAARHAAPPEGAGPGGIDFGHWRNADTTVYGRAFQLQISQRYAGRSATQIRTDLEANGFACQDGQRLDCRIEIMERQCGIDWYVVVEPNAAQPVAGHDVMCLGARRG